MVLETVIKNVTGRVLLGSCSGGKIERQTHNNEAEGKFYLNALQGQSGPEPR